MKVTEDTFNRGLAGTVFGGVTAMHMAHMILESRGTKYERQRYTEDEIRWACQVLGKPVTHERLSHAAKEDQP